jgi:2-polyprenyl-6-methoxyphenol hydroxylase-like FAD-dependent oxidoreductase
MKHVSIVGGGLAGLTLGIGLRRQGIPVTIWEAGQYPRHRVCGEFISGRGQRVLQELGLLEQSLEAGAVRAETAMFFLGNTQGPVRPLPEAALCLSRFDLDALLAREFTRLGGELRSGERWRAENAGEGIVHASGRRVQATEGNWRWFGLKVHARELGSVADLEMYGSASSYVGITGIGRGRANICGLFRRSASEHGALPPRAELLRGAPGTPLRARLESAEFDEDSFCAVAGLSLRPQRAERQQECCIGDALTMIPPVTGNGMSMAFESARIAIEPMAAYSRGEATWTQAHQTVARECDRHFTKRLRWAAWLQAMMFAPLLRHGLGNAVLGSQLIWRVMFAKTR